MSDLPENIPLDRAICPIHKRCYLHYCSKDSCSKSTRLCQECLPMHQDHAKFLTDEKGVSEDLTSGIGKCFSIIDEFDKRTKELQNLINYSKNKSKKQYEEMQCQLIVKMKKDKQQLEEVLQKMKQIHLNVTESNRLCHYFHKLKTLNLINLKLQLSNEQGIQEFKTKNQRYCEFSKKCVFDQYSQKIEKFNKLAKQFQFLLKNNYTFKVGQIISIKKAKKEIRDRLKVNPKRQNQQINPQIFPQKQKNCKKVPFAFQNALREKKENKRPNTMTNIGEGILNGIVNFFR